jgi:hypothetical protein
MCGIYRMYIVVTGDHGDVVGAVALVKGDIDALSENGGKMG